MTIANIKKSNAQKICVIKKLKFENYRNCLNKIDIDRTKENHKEFISNKPILKTQQRFKSERHNVLVKELIRLL